MGTSYTLMDGHQKSQTKRKEKKNNIKQEGHGGP